MKYKDSNIENLQNNFWQEFVEAINIIKDKEHIFIGLSGGSSVNKFYEKLSENFGLIDKKIREKIYFIFLDERIVPLNNEESNYYQLNNTFLKNLKEKNFITQNQILTIDYENDDIAKDYSKKVEKIDIALFGTGPDGHIASLFPNHQLLENQNYQYLQIEDSPKEPLKRITISPRMIKDINFVFLFFMGEGKKEAFKNFLNKNLTYKECPAKLLKNTNKLLVFSDIN